MSLSRSQKKLLVIMVAFACVFSSGAEAWSWSWSWDGSSGSGSSSGTNPDGSQWSCSWYRRSRSCSRWKSSGSNHNDSSSGHKGSIPGTISNHHNGTISNHHNGTSSSHNNGPISNHHNGTISNHHNGTISNHHNGTSSSHNNGTISNHHNGTSSGHNNGTITNHNHNGTISNHNGTSSGHNDLGPREMIVGGSHGWRYGNGTDANISEWASKNAPFYVGDVLVFEYNNLTNRRHDVYLLPNLWSYMSCNFDNGNKIASSTELRGSRDSFRFTLAMPQPYFFACSERNGDFCKIDGMKFSVIPESR